MSYDGPFPLPFKAGGTNVSVLNPGVLSSDGNFVGSDAVDQYAALVGGIANHVTSVDPSATVGYALCSNGNAADPSFQPVPGASMIWLASQTASNSASIQFVSLISAPYTIFKVIFYSVYPVNDTNNLIMQVSSDNGATWDSTDYFSGTNRAPTNSSTLTNTNITSGFLTCAAMTNDTSLSGASGFLDMYNFRGIGIPCTFCQAFNQVTGAATGRISFGGGVNSPALNVNAIQFICSTGNISGGTFALYGIKESS